MNDTDSTLTPPEPQPPAPFVPAPEGVLEVYCNVFNVNWTLFDVRIRLAQLTPSPDADTTKVGLLKRVAKERAAVTFAWPELKLLRDALDDAVRRYEAKNGEIRAIEMP